MKFQNYLNEKNDINIDSIFDTLINDCKPYIEAIKKANKVLVSGRNNIELEFSKREVKTDRVPKNTPIQIHKLLDNLFYDKFGVKARSGTLFCYTNSIHEKIQTFNSYGHAYFVFPIGNFDIINNTNISDLYIEVNKLLYDEIGHPNNFTSLERIFIEFEKTGKYIFGNKEWNYKDYMILTKQLIKDYLLKDYKVYHNSIEKTGKYIEMMLYCKNYYLLDVDVLWDGKIVYFFNKLFKEV